MILPVISPVTSPVRLPTMVPPLTVNPFENVVSPIPLID